MGSKPMLLAGLVVLALGVVAVLPAWGEGESSDATRGSSSAQPAPEAQRDALAQSAKVQGAPGRDLVLSRVVVPPGAKLALHHHLGTQVAHIESGVLTYTVSQGSVVVSRGQSDEDPTVVRAIRAGQTAAIKPGQWIVEQPSDIHRAANKGGKPVVIYLATLLKAGAPPATVVSEDGY